MFIIFLKYSIFKKIKNGIISTVQGTATVRYPVPYTGRKKLKKDCAETSQSITKNEKNYKIKFYDQSNSLWYFVHFFVLYIFISQDGKLKYKIQIQKNKREHPKGNNR